MTGQITIGYWTIRGLGQPIRLLLEFAGLPYKSDNYTTVVREDGSIDKSCWFSVKDTLGLPMPNLPYLIEGDFKLTETGAIILYLAEKGDLLGKTIEERARANQFFFWSNDVRARYMAMSYSPKDKFEDAKKAFIAFVVPKLKFAEDVLQQPGRTYLAGDNITFVDIVVYDLMDQILRLDANLVQEHAPSVVKHHDIIHELPSIKAYRESERFIDTPFNNVFATFNGY